MDISSVAIFLPRMLLLATLATQLNEQEVFLWIVYTSQYPHEGYKNTTLLHLGAIASRILIINILCYVSQCMTRLQDKQWSRLGWERGMFTTEDVFEGNYDCSPVPTLFGRSWKVTCCFELPIELSDWNMHTIDSQRGGRLYMCTDMPIVCVHLTNVHVKV